MNCKYRRVGSRKWEDAICIGFYGELGFFILRWSALFEDFEEVLVPNERLRLPDANSQP